MGHVLQLQTTDPNGKSANIAALCRSITWSGDHRNVCRKLTFSPVVSGGEVGLPQPPIELGGHVRFSMDSQLLMDAFSLERIRDSLSHTADVTAYDRGLYLNRNFKSMRVEGLTAEQVTTTLCHEFGIEVGELARTGVAITRNFLAVSLYKIIMTLYSLAADVTGKKYRVRFHGSALEVVEMAVGRESLLLIPGSNLISCTTRESASAMTNSVAIYDEQYRTIATVEDSTSSALYGMMQQAIRAGSYQDPDGHARRLLEEGKLQTTISIVAMGNPKLITGNTVAVREPVTNTHGLFWILSDTHTWKNGLYQTKLSVSLEAIMDSQTAGSLPTQ